MFTISHFVELDIFLDVFCELYGVSGFTHTQEQDLLTQLEHLVIIWWSNTTAHINIMRDALDRISRIRAGRVSLFKAFVDTYSLLYWPYHNPAATGWAETAFSSQCREIFAICKCLLEAGDIRGREMLFLRAFYCTIRSVFSREKTVYFHCIHLPKSHNSHKMYERFLYIYIYIFDQVRFL